MKKNIKVVTVRPDHPPIQLLTEVTGGVEPPFALTYKRRIRVQDPK